MASAGRRRAAWSTSWPTRGRRSARAHDTTRLCLELLLEIEPGGALVDLGCGSSVLAIAAAKLGWDPVTGVDHERESVRATAENAAANGVAVTAEHHDLVHDGPGPGALTVVANLLGPLLRRVARDGLRGERPRALIASGLLAIEAGDVADALAAGFGCGAAPPLGRVGGAAPDVGRLEAVATGVALGLDALLAHLLRDAAFRDGVRLHPHALLGDDLPLGTTGSSAWSVTRAPPPRCRGRSAQRRGWRPGSARARSGPPRAGRHGGLDVLRDDELAQPRAPGLAPLRADL